MTVFSQTQPIYAQIDSRSSNLTNLIIKGIDNTSATGNFTLGATQNVIDYEFNGNVAFTVVSSSTADTNSSGIGARTIIVKGLFCDTGDSNKYKPRQATYTLNGTTNVTTASTGTNSFAVVNSVEVGNFGSGNCNQGAIKVMQTGALTNIFGIIPATFGASTTLSFGVSDRNELLVSDMHVTATMQSAFLLEIYTQSLNTGNRLLVTKLPITDKSSNIVIPLNINVEKNHVIYGKISHMETVVGTNLISVSVETVLKLFYKFLFII